MQAKNPDNNIKRSFTQLLTKLKELENGFQGWVSKQSLPVEAAVVATTSGIQGAGVGLFYGTLAQFESVKKMVPFEVIYCEKVIFSFLLLYFFGLIPFIEQNFGKTRSLQARNFAVLVGTDAAITCALKRFTGKEDVVSRMVAAFASGFLFQMACAGPRFTVADATIYGAVFAAWQGLVHNEGLVHQVFNFSHLPPVLEESHYSKARSMLSNLSLQRYEKNFKKNLFTDSALPLLKDSDFKEAEIPIGARVLILDHIKRDADLPKMQES
ncbi:hypothetical protein MKW94_008221 [Papaver nudicaule]|uniref:SAM domain-containing protein n=1 Tax=Papaver nudicaule TaxID=74823 RepID=A0AA41VF26_PAPNU|nr:hypothetical protein [Papaver nudicaule]